MRTIALWMLVLFVGGAWAQEKEPSKPSPAPETFYRLHFTIRELQDQKTISSRNYDMTLADDRNWGDVKTGAKIPVVTGVNPQTAVIEQYQYVDVGVHLRCRAHAGETPGLVVFCTMEFSSPALSESSNASADLARKMPVLRTTTADFTTFLNLAKPEVVTSLDDPSMPRRFEVEVTATKLK